jgi:hypothetical protein
MTDGADGSNGAGLVGDRELRICTVRIDVRGAPAGSGFFVAPGQVVTCAHVLEGLDPSAPGAAGTISVSDVENYAYEVESVPSFWPDDDLAVLRVAPAYRHPCVLSIRGVRLFDRFVTFGYPQEHREGLPRTLESEGTTGDERLQAFAAGQVQQGMSGAPVLNIRTGGVCGVLSRTRNQALDLGGYAIPIERLFLRSPTLERLNKGYHEAYRDWFDKLSPKQKSVLLDARPGASSGFTSVFVVSVGREENDWAVSATLHPGGHVGHEEVDLNSVREKVARLFRDWASRGRADPGEVAPGRFDPGEEVRLLGGILFSAVLPGAIGKRFEEVLPRGDERLLLALHFKQGLHPAIVEMPWEQLYLYRPGVQSDVQVARADKLAFVRVLESDPREPEQPSIRQLSALLVGVSPRTAAGQEPPAARVLAAAPSVDRGLDNLTLEPLDMPTAEQLQQKIAAGVYDIVHYVGFGEYRDGADQLALQGVGGFQYLDADRFAMRLEEDRLPRVVVLQQVEVPKDVPTRDEPQSVPADLSMFAWGLLNRGVEAVVAYQFPMAPQLTVAFNAEFYAQLAAGQSFEMAVQKARSALWKGGEGMRAYLSPAAFVARPGELRLTAPPADSAPLARVGVTAGHA